MIDMDYIRCLGWDSKKCRWTGVAGNVLWRPPFHGQIKVKLLFSTALQPTFSVRGGSWFRTIKIRSEALWDGLICLFKGKSCENGPILRYLISEALCQTRNGNFKGVGPAMWRKCVDDTNIRPPSLFLKEEESDTSTFNLTATTADLNTFGPGWSVCSIWWCQSMFCEFAWRNSTWYFRN